MDDASAPPPDPAPDATPDATPDDVRDPTALTLTELAAAYRAGTLRPSEVTEAFLERLEPGPVYRTVNPDRARRQAARADARFAAGFDAGPLQGIPLGIKDLFDLEGEITAAGSAALLDDPDYPPAASDAPAVARLDAAGAVFLGRTGMTELAFSGLGINPHFGTPGNAFDAARVPGGSSSGSAVAVATGLAAAAVGSDTGGSVRIPAAFNGLVGLKTTDGRIPTEGALPLSTTLDTVGPLARTSEDAWALFQALAAERPQPLGEAPRRLRLLALETIVLDGLDASVAAAWEAWLERVEAQGHEVVRAPLEPLAEIPALYRAHGSFANHEAYALHRRLLERRGERIDPRVAGRILPFAERPAVDYLTLVYARQRVAREVWDAVAPYHAVLAPTVATLPPTITSLAADEAYFTANGLCLRNTMLFNFLGGPAASAPIGRARPGGDSAAPELPVGGMIATAPGRDRSALRIARALTGV